MTTILKNLFNTSVLSDSFKFAEASIYRIPNYVSLEEFENLVD
jgi:hypothetical protein